VLTVLTVLFRTVLLFIHTAGMQQLKKWFIELFYPVSFKDADKESYAPQKLLCSSRRVQGVSMMSRVTVKRT
jgi:hypothetical protein